MRNIQKYKEFYFFYFKDPENNIFSWLRKVQELPFRYSINRYSFCSHLYCLTSFVETTSSDGSRNYVFLFMKNANHKLFEAFMIFYYARSPAVFNSLCACHCDDEYTSYYCSNRNVLVENFDTTLLCIDVLYPALKNSVSVQQRSIVLNT